MLSVSRAFLAWYAARPGAGPVLADALGWVAAHQPAALLAAARAPAAAVAAWDAVAADLRALGAREGGDVLLAVLAHPAYPAWVPLHARDVGDRFVFTPAGPVCRRVVGPDDRTWVVEDPRPGRPAPPPRLVDYAAAVVHPV
jgi:hypothetical protein